MGELGHIDDEMTRSGLRWSRLALKAGRNNLKRARNMARNFSLLIAATALVAFASPPSQMPGYHTPRGHAGRDRDHNHRREHRHRRDNHLGHAQTPGTSVTGLITRNTRPEWIASIAIPGVLSKAHGR